MLRALVALIVVPLLLAAVVVARTVWSEYQATQPPRRPLAPPGELAVRAVVLRTADQLQLRGWYLPGRNGAAVVLVHGYGGNRAELLPEARLLGGRGYGVLLYDARAHGESEGARVTYGDRERLDLRAAVDFLAARPEVHAIGALGFSVGASAVALEAAADPRVRAVALLAPTTSIADSSRDEFGGLAWLKTVPTLLVLRALGVNVAALDLRAAVAKLAPRPLLVVHGDRDPVIPVQRGRQLFEVAGAPKQLLIVRGAGHGDYQQHDPGYTNALVGLFDRGLQGNTERQQLEGHGGATE